MRNGDAVCARGAVQNTKDCVQVTASSRAVTDKGVTEEWNDKQPHQGRVLAAWRSLRFSTSISKNFQTSMAHGHHGHPPFGHPDSH